MTRQPHAHPGATSLGQRARQSVDDAAPGLGTDRLDRPVQNAGVAACATAAHALHAQTLGRERDQQTLTLPG